MLFFPDDCNRVQCLLDCYLSRGLCGLVLAVSGWRKVRAS